jgi:hypothetical protein
VINWLNLFADFHNRELKTLKWTEPKRLNDMDNNNKYFLVTRPFHMEFLYLLLVPYRF